MFSINFIYNKFLHRRPKLSLVVITWSLGGTKVSSFTPARVALPPLSYFIVSWSSNLHPCRAALPGGGRLCSSPGLPASCILNVLRWSVSLINNFNYLQYSRDWTCCWCGCRGDSRTFSCFVCSFPFVQDQITTVLFRGGIVKSDEAPGSHLNPRPDICCRLKFTGKL